MSWRRAREMATGRIETCDRAGRLRMREYCVEGETRSDSSFQYHVAITSRILSCLSISLPFDTMDFLFFVSVDQLFSSPSFALSLLFD